MQQPNTSGHHYTGRPETIEETEEMVEALGGRGITVRIAHALEREVVCWSGGVYSSWGRSREYGFTDLDGTRPNIWPAVAAATARSSGAPRAAVQWQLTRVSD